MLDLYARGLQRTDIAALRGVSTDTVKTQCSSILRKLHLKTMNQAAARWLRLQLVLDAVRKGREVNYETTRPR